MPSEIEKKFPEHVLTEIEAIAMSDRDVPSKLEALMSIEALSAVPDEGWNEVASYLVEINQALQEAGETPFSLLDDQNPRGI
jgi:hypothetical protein